MTSRGKTRRLDASQRPFVEGPMRAVLRGLVSLSPDELGHVDVGRIIITAGAARRGARASIRPLTLGGRPPRFEEGTRQKPRVRRLGRLMLYELNLRPLYFQRTSPRERLHILAHELWHIGPSADGTLDPARRHAVASRSQSERFADDVASRALAAGLDVTILDYDGEIRIPMWLERPPSLIPPERASRLEYDDRDLFTGIVAQRGLEADASDSSGKPDRR